MSDSSTIIIPAAAGATATVITFVDRFGGTTCEWTLPIVAWVIEGDSWSTRKGVPVLPVNLTEFDTVFVHHQGKLIDVDEGSECLTLDEAKVRVLVKYERSTGTAGP